MDRLPNKSFEPLFTIIYTSYLSIILFLGWISKLNYLEITSILTPGISTFNPPSVFSRFIISLSFDPIITNYILLFISSTSTLYITLKFRIPLIIPFFMLSIYLGDYISPILFSISAIIEDKRVKSIIYALLVIHEPIYLIPFLASRTYKKDVKWFSYIVVFLFLLFLYRVRYVNYAFQTLPDINLLIPILLTITLSITAFRFEGLLSLSILFSPYASLTQALYRFHKREGSNLRRADIYVLLVVMLLFLGFIFVPQKTVINLNGSLDRFLSESLGNASIVLSLSKDSYVNSILTSRGIYVVQFGDSFSWNWSDLDEAREKLSKALEYAENHGIKYVLVDKPEELAYWVSKVHYREYKYPMREPLGRYIIVLERLGIVETAKENFYLKDFNADPTLSLSRDFTRYWSNISIQINVSNEYIQISGDSAYEVYLHFDVEDIKGYYLFKLEGSNDYFRSIEFYVYDGKLKSLWETSRKRIYNPIMVGIDSNAKGEFVFKIEDNNSLKLYLYKLESPEIYEVRRLDQQIVVTPKNSLIWGILSDFTDSLTISFGDGEASITKISGAENLQRLELMSLVITVALLSILFSKEELGPPPMIGDFNVSTVYLYLYFIGLPMLIYLVHPRLLEISWIGGGVFLIAFSMGVFTLLLESDKIGVNRSRMVLLSIPTIISLSFIVKYFYGDIFDLIGDFWRNQSLYASIDVVVYGFLGLLLSLYVFGMRNTHFHIPFIYLVVSGTSFITDLLRILNPVLQGLIDLATYFVEITMETFGYRIEYVTVPAGNALYVYNGKLLTVVILGWPCTGITGIFIFLSFATVLNIYFRNRFGYPISKYLILAGLLITYMLNIVRIDAILYLDIYYGVDASELFHSIGYELVFLFWIAIYFFIVYRIYLKRSS